MTTPITVLDASAILAFLHGEPGQDQVEQALRQAQCVVSAANQAEVIAKSLDRGVAPQAIQAMLAALAYTVVDITAEDGSQAGWLRDWTRTLGLSLGDRLCLAMARRLQARVLTADRPWTQAAPILKIDIRCIRPEQH